MTDSPILITLLLMVLPMKNSAREKTVIVKLGESQPYKIRA